MQKKIAFIRRNFRSDGGAEIAANSYLLSLQKKHQLSLICESWDSAFLDVEKKIVKTNGFSRTAKYLSFVRQAQNFIQQNDFISHSHEWIPGANILRLGDGLHSDWLAFKNKPRRFNFFEPFHKVKLNLEKESLSHPNLRKVIVNSNLIGNAVMARYGLEENNIALIRNTVTQRFLEHEPLFVNVPNPQLLFIGSGWARKGLSYALQAFQKLPNNWIFNVVGQDKNFRFYNNLAKKLKISTRVKFLGVMAVGPEVFSNVTALIHPAIYEPFPNVAIEALSQGVPVISSPNSGTSDFSKAEGVWTVTNSVVELSGAILEAASLSSREKYLFREHICQFDSVYLDETLDRIYEQVLN